MKKFSFIRFFNPLASLLASLIVLAALSVEGSVIWNGPTITFTEASGANGSQPADQDRMTFNVWLTRNLTQGLYNAKTESSYTHFSSPADTAWAYGSLANYASLTYNNWETWNGHNPPSMVGQNAVLHLISDDIYLSVKFISWGGSSGGFSYQRSTPSVVPEPSAALMMLAGLAASGMVWHRRRVLLKA